MRKDLGENRGLGLMAMRRDNEEVSLSLSLASREGQEGKVKEARP